jgi:hypothetical protein
MTISPQLAYYYRKGKEARKIKQIKHKAREPSRVGYIKQIPIQAKRLFLHRLWVSYPLLASTDAKPGEQLQLRYTRQQLFQTDGISCRLTTKHLIVEGIQLWGSIAIPAPELRSYAEELADRVAEQAGKEYALKLNLAQRKSKLVEIAITSHEGARGLTDRRKGKIVLYQEPVSKKVVWADRTPNPASLESDSDKLIKPWQDLTKAMEEGRWSADSQLALNQSFMEEQHKFFKTHNDLMLQITRMLKRLDSEQRQRRL